MTIAQELADRLLSRPSSEDREYLRALTLTNVAAGIGFLGRSGELIKRLPLDPTRPGDAAFANAARLHARTQDDFHPFGRIHVGAVTLATALATSDLTGERLLDALAAGYEAMCLVATAYSAKAQRRGLRPTGMFGPIGAAATAAVALGLDRDGVANALGLAAARSGGTMQSWLSGSDEWVLEPGAAARAGLEAALFSQAGAVASLEAFEGRAGWSRAYFGDDAEPLRAALARPGSYVSEVAVKPYPVSGIAQVPTELACRAKRAVGGGTVRSAVIRLSPSEASYPGSSNGGPFRSRSDALMSVPFCIACAFTDGAVRIARLESPNELSDLVAVVELVSDEALGEGEGVLRLDVDGEILELSGDGSELLHPTWEALTADSAAALAVRSEAEPDAVAATVEHLRPQSPDARPLAEVFGVAA